MIYLLDTSHDYDRCAAELGVDGAQVGQLLTPRTRFANRGRALFAIDNGCYTGFDERGFMSLLEREEPNRERCLFVVAPDVVGSARRTLEVFTRWTQRLYPWPIAFACQNGQEDLPIPWEDIAAVFIGGDNAWKTSMHARAIVKAAQLLGKWTHVGRVNQPARYAAIADWGVGSIDGSGISLHTHQRERLLRRTPHPSLELACVVEEG